MSYSHPFRNRTYLKDRRRDLRNWATPAERRLWMMLRRRQAFGLKFRRQDSIENYIADFCCPAKMLIIELDGAVHFQPGQAAYDRRRDARLRELGYTILRFENRIVFEQPELILEALRKAAGYPEV